MEISKIPFDIVDWKAIPAEEHPGIEGKAIWHVVKAGDIRIRMVEYTPGYIADHWCKKGHIILVLEGELETELDDGRKFTLTAGMSYHVADNNGSHRSQTKTGAKLFIVD